MADDQVKQARVRFDRITDAYEAIKNSAASSRTGRTPLPAL